MTRSSPSTTIVAVLHTRGGVHAGRVRPPGRPLRGGAGADPPRARSGPHPGVARACAGFRRCRGGTPVRPRGSEARPPRHRARGRVTCMARNVFNCSGQGAVAGAGSRGLLFRRGVEFWRKGYIFGNPFRDFDGPWKADRFPTADEDEIGGRLPGSRQGSSPDAPLTFSEPNGPLHPTTLTARARNRRTGLPPRSRLHPRSTRSDAPRETAWNAPAAVVDPNVLAIPGAAAVIAEPDGGCSRTKCERYAGCRKRDGSFCACRRLCGRMKSLPPATDLLSKRTG